MGIPVYFKALVTQYQDDILVKKHLRDIQSLFFDLNCLIHPCCKSVSDTGCVDESHMIDTIIHYIEKLISYTDAKTLVYIAIDGVCPKAKMKQQRERRHKSAYEKKKWDTNAISPGTEFMRRLNLRIREWMDIYGGTPKIILSDSTVPGEGEHKILEYLRQNKVQGKVQGKTVIYGLDADLVMLGLVSGINDLYLLRERTAYNIEDTESPYIYLSIPELRLHILKDIGIISRLDADTVIYDYIFMCFLLGNDFINHCPSLSLRYGGLETLLATYKLLQQRYMGHYRLVDTRLPACIQLPFFKEFLAELAKTEDRRLTQIRESRRKQRGRVIREYGEMYRTFPKEKGAFVKQSTMDLFQKSSKTPDTAKDMCEHLPLLCEVVPVNTKNPDISQDYIDSLVWTAIYYFRGCESWTWHTEFSEAPLIKHLYEYIRDIPCLHALDKSKPLTEVEQLTYIFPPSSHSLHRYEIHGKAIKDLVYDLRDKRYLWECAIEIL